MRKGRGKSRAWKACRGKVVEGERVKPSGGGNWGVAGSRKVVGGVREKPGVEMGSLMGLWSCGVRKRRGGGNG